MLSVWHFLKAAKDLRKVKNFIFVNLFLTVNNAFCFSFWNEK